MCQSSESSSPHHRQSTPRRGVYRKENEKQRSKYNRDKFKQYMEEMNECMGFKKLSINKCLSTAVSLLKLDMFSARFVNQEHQVAPDIFYDVGNYLGLAFDENGRILHITPRNSEHPLPFNMCQAGSFISQICFNTTEILQKVFQEDSQHLEMRLKYSKKNKQPTEMFFTGKVMYNSAAKIKMFIGYGLLSDKKDSVRDPFMFSTGFEVWIDSNYDVIKSHSWLELLVGGAVKHLKGDPVSIFSLLHPDDMDIIAKCEEQMKLCGRFKTSCRIYDGENYLWISARGFRQRNTDRSKRVAEVYVWPFAYEDFKTGDMFLVDIKKMWGDRQKKGKLPKIPSPAQHHQDEAGSDGGYEAGSDAASDANTSDSCSSDECRPVLVIPRKPRKRPFASESSYASDDSYGSSPKRMAVTSLPDAPSTSKTPIKPLPKRSSAFEIRRGAFVPVVGNIPNPSFSPEVPNYTSTEILTPSLELSSPEPKQLIFKPTEILAPTPVKSSPESVISPIFRPPEKHDTRSFTHQVERLSEINAVFRELKEANPSLYKKMAGVLDHNNQPSDVLLSFLPLILKLQVGEQDGEKRTTQTVNE